MKIVELLNERNECECIFLKRPNSIDNVLDGVLLNVTGWMGGIPTTVEYVADVWIKPDGDSHFYFYGEGYDGSKPTEDDNSYIPSYYNFYGFNSYIKHFKGLMFVYQLAKDTIGYSFDDTGTAKHNDLTCLSNILKGCTLMERTLDNFPYLEETLLGYINKIT